MSTYISLARTNEFRVRDTRAFLDDLRHSGFDVSSEIDGVIYDEPDLVVVPSVTGDADVVVILSGTPDQGWPTTFALDESDATLDVNTVVDATMLNLAPGAVAIFTEVGFEKRRAQVGVAIAMNARGEVIEIDLVDAITTQARETFGKDAEILR